MNLRQILLAMGLAGTALAQDAKEPPKAARLDYIVEKGDTFRLPMHSVDNHNAALSIIEKVQAEMQEQETKLAAEQKRAPRRIEFSPEEMFWYADTHLNSDGWDGISVGEVLEAIANNEKFKGLPAPNRKSNSPSMELQTPRYAYEDSNAPEKLLEKIDEKAKKDKTDSTSLFQKMMKAKIAKSYGASKVKTEEGQAVLITNAMIERFEREKDAFYLPGAQIVADMPGAVEPKPEPANEYIVDFTVKFDSPLDAAIAMKYVEIKSLYNRIAKAGEPAKTEEEKIFMLAQIAGDDNHVSGAELEARVNSLKADIATLRSNEDKELPILDWGKYTVGKSAEVRGYIKVTMAPEDKKRMKETAGKYGFTKGHELVWLGRNYTQGAAKGEGTMTAEQATAAIKAVDEEYAPKEDKK